MPWHHLEQNNPASWTCGYCGCAVGGDRGYFKTPGIGGPSFDANDRIYICPRCDNPTAFISDEGGNVLQIPAHSYGTEVGGLPKSVSALYDEIRSCYKSHAYTSAILSARKLLMHVAVEQGAREGLGVDEYVDFLANAGCVGPNGRVWVDEIRKAGNEANHEIVLKGKSDAAELIDFIELLLRVVYEFPSRMRNR